MLGLKELSLLPAGAVVVNTARGPIVDIDALATLLKSGHLAGVGLDVVPVEPPVEPVPELIRAYREREAWTLGRLIITPHSAFYTPQAWDDIRVKSAETMRAALPDRGHRTLFRRKATDPSRLLIEVRSTRERRRAGCAARKALRWRKRLRYGTARS